MTFTIFGGLWRCVINRARSHHFQFIHRRSADGGWRSNAGWRWRVRSAAARSSALYAVWRYGFHATPSLSLSVLAAANDSDNNEKLSNDKKSTMDDQQQRPSATPSAKLVNTADDFSEASSINWDQIYQDENITVFRRYRDDLGSGLYEYRCTGSYNDITPTNFVETQNDVAYRQRWDENVISLEVVAEDADQQTISWVTRYPYPMYAREYVYLCRKSIDADRRTIVVENVAVGERERPSTGKYVRVTRYRSRLVVRAHHALDEKGLDYTLTYYDDPKSSIPTMAYNWIVHKGGPYFMQKIYQAAIERAAEQEKRDEVTKATTAAAKSEKKAPAIGDSATA